MSCVFGLIWCVCLLQESWSDEAIAAFTDLAMERKLDMTVVDVDGERLTRGGGGGGGGHPVSVVHTSRPVRVVGDACRRTLGSALSARVIRAFAKINHAC